MQITAKKTSCLVAFSFILHLSLCVRAEEEIVGPVRSPGKTITQVQWAWMRGAKVVNQTGVYGLQGEAGDATVPGGRRGGARWRDAVGAMWLFGGAGYGASGGAGFLNDLWRFDAASNQWTWVKGGSVIDPFGVYGIKGVASAENCPGGRMDAATWVDESGCLWMFGGLGRAAATQNHLNDLWRFDPVTGHWTWMEGTAAADQAGVYGQQGTPSDANAPGARRGAAYWMDETGAFWLFGGYGIDALGHMGALNDVWKYDRVTGNWVWVKGASTISQKGEYGTVGVAGPGNTPGARSYSASWREASGLVWLFGGLGYDQAGTMDYLSDLWKFDSAASMWTWVGGSSTGGQSGSYGVLGVPAPENAPGGRCYAVSWLDASGAMWLHGGYGCDSIADLAYLNDMWKLDSTTGLWTWMKGSSRARAVGVYGTLGTAALGNAPGARAYASSWADTSGALWLFGGIGYGGSASTGLLNDLWRWDQAPLPTYEITFQTDGTQEASLTGSTLQTIAHGCSGTPVWAVAPASHHFVQWTKGGVAYSSSNPLTVTNVTAAMTLTANFMVNLYTLKYTAGEHGSITGHTQQWVSHGASGTGVTAVAMQGFHFVRWSDGLTTPERTDANVTASLDVTAEFAVNQYALSYAALDYGTIVGSTVQLVPHGANGSEVMASAATGYHFVQWSDGSTQNPRVDTNVTNDLSVMAEFAINQYTLSYSTEGNGSITGPATQTVPYGGGGTAVVAVPGIGCHFVGWSDGSRQNPRVDSSITEDLSVAAVFALNEYELTYLAGPNGTISGVLVQIVEYGKNGASVIAEPEPGYRFALWSDGLTNAERIDRNVTHNVQVTANFERDEPPVIPVGEWAEVALTVCLGALAILRLAWRRRLQLGTE